MLFKFIIKDIVNDNLRYFIDFFKYTNNKSRSDLN